MLPSACLRPARRVSLCGAMLAVSLFASAAVAAPRWVRVSLPGSDAASSMAVAWNSDSASDPTTVEYGTSQSKLDQTASGTSFAAKGKLGTGHEVTLTGLSPDTTYYYRVGGAGSWSAIHHFTTGPKTCGSFSFIASGDHRSDDSAGPNPKWESILGEMTASGARFILETGDLVRDGSDLNQWWNHMEMGAKHMGEIALMPSFGNHDSDDVKGAAAAYNQIFALPSNDASKTEDFYAFTYGNAIFVALSTATFDDAAGFAQQAQWLDQVLAQNADKTWKIVYFHHPILTSYVDLKFIDLNHPANEKGQAAAFVPVFDKHHVDIVFAGHNHFYERFAPTKNGKQVGSPADGTVYVTTGGAGAFTYDTIDVFGFKIEPMKVICGEGVLGFTGKAPGSQICTGKHHYVSVTIDKNLLKATVYATAAQNLSTNDGNKGVIETWQIQKAPLPPSACGTSGDADAGSSDAGAADAGSADAGTSDTVAADAGPSDIAASDSGPADTGAPDTASADVGGDLQAPDSSEPADTQTDAATPDDSANSGTDVAVATDSAVVADTSGGNGAPLGGADTGGTGATKATPAANPSGCSANPSSQGGLAWLALAGAAFAVWRRRDRDRPAR
ncbi:MAG: metallophosphoesterase family protein [Deltaproteobacteria bacterium]|nr:metallophosphoesterase family protein [Deltaproteobacteria bacterium]